ncbi:MAG: VC_2705 family sodium/solute symporter [Bacteroidales bacterium]|nr:VC_2705 family sodium/solute symporter [Bacteroidales bacterium]
MNKYIFSKRALLLGLAALPLLADAATTSLEGEFRTGPAIILITILILFVVVGIVFRAKDTTDFYAAGRSISRVGSGMAIASNWMSAASFLGMAALMYGFGYHGLAFVVGWTGGYVLLLVLMAGQIRRYGKYTAPDFIGDRYYSQGLRATAAILVLVISIAYCVGQFGGIGLMFKWILGFNYTWSVIIGGSVVLTYTLISGMLGVTKNQQIQYVIIIVSFMIPAFLLTFKFDYLWIMPAIGYGQCVSDIVDGLPVGDLVNSMGHAYAIMPAPEFAMPWDPVTGKSFYVWMAIAFSLMVGTAGLPHVLQRFYIVPKTSDARWSVVWGLFFICILYWFAPVYSALGVILSSDPEVGKLAKDAIVVYTAQLGGIHPLVVGLLAAGGVSAAFSTVSGLFVSGASAFSHDLYVKVFNPDAAPKKQLLMARLGTIVMAVIVTGLALLKLALIGQLVAVAFSLAACTMFPMFLLGIWWSGSNKQGAIAGVIVGVLISAIALFNSLLGVDGSAWIAEWMGPWHFGLIGAPLAILSNVVVSKLTKPTPIEIRKFLVEQVHS